MTGSVGLAWIVATVAPTFAHDSHAFCNSVLYSLLLDPFLFGLFLPLCLQICRYLVRILHLKVTKFWPKNNGL